MQIAFCSVKGLCQPLVKTLIDCQVPCPEMLRLERHLLRLCQWWRQLRRWLQQQQQARQLPTLQWEKEEVTQGQIPWQQQQQRRELHQRQRLFRRPQVLLPPVWLPVHQATRRLLWLIKKQKSKSAPGQAITDNNQHNNIDKKFYVNNNKQEI